MVRHGYVEKRYRFQHGQCTRAPMSKQGLPVQVSQNNLKVIKVGGKWHSRVHHVLVEVAFGCPCGSIYVTLRLLIDCRSTSSLAYLLDVRKRNRLDGVACCGRSFRPPQRVNDVGVQIGHHKPRAKFALAFIQCSLYRVLRIASSPMQT